MINLMHLAVFKVTNSKQQLKEEDKSMFVIKLVPRLARSALMADAHSALLVILSPMADASFQLMTFVSQDHANSVPLEHM